jgi:deoxyribonuclease V
MLLHEWDISPREAVALQTDLARRVVVAPLGKTVETIAGADCAFLDGGKRIAAVAILCEAQTLQTVVSTTEVRPCEFPYVPGLLSFREAPAVIAAVEKLPVRPDLLMCDGQGLAHPRGFGLASHVGLWLDLPTIGAAKSLLCGEHRPPGRRRGSSTRIRYDGRVVGAAVRTRDGVKPLYVSVGHRITLEEAIAWTLRTTRGVRLPEPSRQAHRLVSQVARM